MNGKVNGTIKYWWDPKVITAAGGILISVVLIYAYVIKGGDEIANHDKAVRQTMIEVSNQNSKALQQLGTLIQSNTNAMQENSQLIRVLQEQLRR